MIETVPSYMYTKLVNYKVNLPAMIPIHFDHCQFEPSKQVNKSLIFLASQHDIIKYLSTYLGM